MADKFLRTFRAMPRLVRVTLLKSPHHALDDIQTTLKMLGLKKINQSVVQKNNSVVRGYINKAKRYVTVEDEPLPKLAELDAFIARFVKPTSTTKSTTTSTSKSTTTSIPKQTKTTQQQPQKQ